MKDIQPFFALKKVFLLAGVLFFLSIAHAQNISGSVIKNADSLKLDKATNQLILDGHVQIIYDQQFFSANHATFNTKTKLLVAQGDVIIRSATIYAECDRVEMNLNQNTGTLYNGFVQSGTVSFEGETIERKGANEFEVTSGIYTACTTCPPAWSFSGTKVKASFGGYARIKNPIFRIANFPILWLPYLIIPLKSDRQTGLLFPSFGFEGDSGGTFAESLYYVINDSQDATLTFKNYANRGQKGLLNYRYVLAPESSGTFNFATLNDKQFGGAKRVTDVGHNGSPLQRWGMKYKNVFTMPEGYAQRTNLNLLSDLQYVKDFPDEFQDHGDPALTNQVSLTKNSETSHASVDIDYYVNLLKKNALINRDDLTDPLNKDFGGNRDAVHRLPEFRFHRTHRPIADTKLLFNFDADYVNFARDNYTYDQISNAKLVGNDGGSYNQVSAYNSLYNSSHDQIRTGQRLDLRPTILLPFSIGNYFDFLPSITYRETNYQFAIGDQPSAQRRYVRDRISGRTHFNAIFDGEHDTKYKHEIQPELIYSNIPISYRSQHPFFGTDTGDVFYKLDQPVTDGQVLQFDYNDRLTERNLGTFALTNTLTRKTLIDDQANYRQILLWRLSQDYDFYEAARSEYVARQVWSNVTSYLDIRLDYFETNSLINYYPYEGITNSSSRMKIKDSKENYAQLAYTQTFKITPGVPVNYSTRTEDYELSMGTNFKYIALSGALSYSTVVYAIRSYSYNLKLKPPGNCWEINLNTIAPTDSKPIFGFNFGLVFDGKSATSVGGKGMAGI